MKKTIFRKLLLAMGITLALTLLMYPLLLPTENYFRLVLQILPVAVVIGALLIIPVYILSDRLSRAIGLKLKTLRIDSKAALLEYPELKPLARQVSSLKAQIATQMNELNGQQEQLKVLTDNMQEGLLLISSAGRVLSHNHAALQLLGAESVSGDYFPVEDLCSSPDFRKLVDHALSGVRGSAVITSGETVCQVTANPVVRGTQITGAALVLMDVTEREQRDALRREFTSNVSHELKTPLTSIYGIADMMGSGMVKQEDTAEFARRIRDESARMISLVEDIIRLSRLDDESFKAEIIPVDLYEIAESVRDQLQPAADSKHITVRLEGSSSPMNGVPVIVEEMLYNLCDNAIKYNDEGGEVCMKVTCTDQSAIFNVTDNGIGIPQADRERIFERFYRVDKSRSKENGGTGLGLSIVKHGALFHNAGIELESKLGKGTSITLYFPCSADAAANAEAAAVRNPLDVDVPGTEQPLITVVEADQQPEMIPETVAAQSAEEILPAEADPVPEEAVSEPAEAESEAEPAETAEASAETEEAAEESAEAAEEPSEPEEEAADVPAEPVSEADTEEFAEEAAAEEPAEDAAEDPEDDLADIFAEFDLFEEEIEHTELRRTHHGENDGFDDYIDEAAEDAESAQYDETDDYDQFDDYIDEAAEDAESAQYDETDDYDQFDDYIDEAAEDTESAQYDETDDYGEDGEYGEADAAPEPEPEPVSPAERRRRRVAQIEVTPIDTDTMDIEI